MKLTRRLQSVAREAADQARDRLGRAEETDAGPAPDSPGSRPRAAYAGVLDGRHLWLAVDATPGNLALRPTGTERVVPLTSDLAEDDPRYRSVRADLSGVPGGPGRFEVVITAPGGKVHRVWTPPLLRGEPVTTPAVDGVQWQVARADDGTLLLVREDAPAAAYLLSISADDDDVATLRLGGVPDGAELRLVDDESGEVLLTLPLAFEGGEAVATVDHRDVPEGIGLSAGVYAGGLPVRRPGSDLTRPDQAVLLPQVQNDTGDGPLFTLVFRWLPDGVLRVRRPKGAAA
ncbi:MAG: hypothetical protein ABIO16_17175 [Nocardioides sp.]